MRAAKRVLVLAVCLALPLPALARRKHVAPSAPPVTGYQKEARTMGIAVAPVGLSARAAEQRLALQQKLLAREVVRAPARTVVAELVAAPGNAAARAEGEALVARLGAKRGVTKAGRKGYTSRDTIYSAKNLASALRLKRGEKRVWDTPTAHYELEATGANSVTVVERPHDVVLTSLRRVVGRIVARLVANPRSKPTRQEQLVLGLAPPDLRAEVLATVKGFKLRRITAGGAANLKYELELNSDDSEQFQLYARVFGPNLHGYMPGHGHSYAIHNEQVLETYSGTTDGLRATSASVYPVALTDHEAKNVDVFFGAALTEHDDVTRSEVSRGRPKPYPPTLKDKSTQNSCTTTFHRMPVGKRSAEMAWLDALETKVLALAKGGRLKPSGRVGSRREIQALKLEEVPLLRALDSLSPYVRLEVLQSLAQYAGLDQTTREQLGTLRTWAEHYIELDIPRFPLELLGREPLKNLIGVPFDRARKGTTDPPGPGFARQMFVGAPERVPVIVRLRERD